MNKKIIVIFILTIIALAILWLYSFGPLAGTRVAKSNPASLKATSQQTVINGQNTALNVYHNRDLAENFYTIKFPQSWQLQTGSPAGSYHFVFDTSSLIILLALAIPALFSSTFKNNSLISIFSMINPLDNVFSSLDNVLVDYQINILQNWQYLLPLLGFCLSTFLFLLFSAKYFKAKGIIKN
jgi:hypothetical protein